MTDDASPNGHSATGALLRAVEELRADAREDIGQLRDDMREDLAAMERRVMGALTDFTVAHGAEHAAGRAEAAAAHDHFDAFIKANELEQARKDGALGLVRFVVELTSRHARPLVSILFAAAAAAGIATGSIHIGISI